MLGCRASWRVALVFSAGGDADDKLPDTYLRVLSPHLLGHCKRADLTGQHALLWFSTQIRVSGEDDLPDLLICKVAALSGLERP